MAMSVMLLFRISLLFCLSVVSHGQRSYTGYHLVRVFPEDDADMKFLERLKDKVDFWQEISRTGHPVDINVPPDLVSGLFEDLSSRHLNFKVIHSDVQQVIHSSETFKSRKGSKLGWDSYYSLEDILGYLQEITVSFPNFTEIVQLGASYEGRNLTGIRINPGNSRFKVWIDGGIHAREWISPAVVTYFINELTVKYQLNSEIADMFDWWILPVHNPDGYVHSWNEDRLWRKNRRPAVQGSGCIGVDLNRNWNFHWMEIGASSNPCSETYAGPEAESEPEVKLVRDLVLNLASDNSVVLFLTMHSYSQLWLSPYGHTTELPDNYDYLEDIMSAAVEAAASVHGRVYEYGTSTNVNGPAAGSSKDWALGVANISASFTVELRPECCTFQLPPEEILPNAEEAWASVKVAARLSLPSNGTH